MIAGLGLWYSASDPAYDAFTYEQAIPTLFDSSGNGWDAAQATGSNQAQFLTHDGENYLRLPGIAGNYLSLPSSAASFNSLDLIVRVNFSDWLNDYPLITQGAVGGTRTFGWRMLNSAGSRFMRFALYFDGNAATLYDTTAQVSITSGWGYVRVTRNAATGAINFYEAATYGLWTQVGATVSGATTALPASAQTINVGAFIATSAYLLGRVSYAELRTTVDGAPAAIFSASLGNFNSATVVDSLGKTWTINRTGLNPAMIVSARAFLPLTDDYYDISASAADVLRNVSGGTVIASRACNTASANLTMLTLSTSNSGVTRFIQNSDSGSFTIGGRRLDADSVVLNATAAQQAAYEYAIQAGVLDYTAATSRNFKNGSPVGSLSAFQTSGNTSDTASAGRRVFTNLGGTNLHSGPVTDLCLYNRALTNAQIFALSRYFAGRTGGAVTV
jgi:hypothetical protein